MRDVVATAVAASRGRISAKRLLPRARTAGYAGSDRKFRRLVAQEKAAWRRDHGRGRRPAVWSPGEHLVIDWCVVAGVHVFCAVLAWSRWRFVRVATDERAGTTLAMLAECFEALGGAPKVVLADRMGCLKGGAVANRVVPTPDYVRFASHYRFRPDFCEAADPESKGIVEALVRYGKDDFLTPLLLEAGGLDAAAAAAVLGELAAANEHTAAWCAEVNAAVHAEVAAVPAERLQVEQELPTPLPSLRLRIGPAPTVRKVDRLGTIRIGSARYSVPNLLVGTSVAVEVTGLRVVIFDASTGLVHAEHALVAPGEASIRDEHYGGPRPAPRRAIRPKTIAERTFCAMGPVAEAFIPGAELLLTAKTQRWAPEEVLRTLIEAEVAARDASNEWARLKAAGFPVLKTVEEFDLTASSIPAPTWAYLTSLEWIGAKENLALIGPAGTGKSHTLIALGHAAVTAGHKVKYLTAADLIETLYRGLADNTVGLLDRLLHHATTVVTSGQSYRMREARTRTGGRPTTS